MSVRRIMIVLAAAACGATGLAAAPSAASAAAPASATGQASPTTLHFADTYAEQDSAPQTVTFTSTGTDDLVIDGAVTFDEDDPDTAASFRITASTCDNATLAPGAHCSVTVVAHPETIGSAGGWLNFVSNGAYVQVTMSVTALEPATGLYYPISPHRILDTRAGVGATQHPVPGDTTVQLQVLGTAGLPATGVAAVVLNLTVTHPTTAGHITAFPSGPTRPDVSSLNYAKGWTGANLLTVAVGTNGKVDLYNSAGSTDLIADVVGWYAASQTVDPSFGTGVGYLAQDPKRLLDTRHLHGGHQPLAPHQEIEVSVPTPTAFAATKVHAAAITLTAVSPAATGYLTAGPIGADLTRSSTLNLRAGVTTPNLAIVPTQACPTVTCPHPTVKLRVYNGSSHAVDVLVDVQGIYAETLYAPYRFHPVIPTRILDTRPAIGPIFPAATRTVTVPTTVASTTTEALVANLTAVNPSANTFLTVWAPSPGAQRPGVSTLNPRAGSTVASGALIGLYPDQQDRQTFDVYNSSGTTNILVDVTGRFDYFQPDDPII